MKQKFKPGERFDIYDWTGRLLAEGFVSFDDAEDFLCDQLGETYETDRQEYEIRKRGVSK